MEKQITDLVEQVKNGEIDGLKAYIELKRLEKTLSESIKTVQEFALTEAAKYGQKTFEFHNAKIELKSGAGTWKFDSYEKYNSVKTQLKSIEENMKAAYNASQKMQTVVDESGEIIPPAQYIAGKDTLAVMLKKENVNS